MKATAHKDIKTQIEYSDVKLIGHLAADPEVRETKSGEQSLSMATAIGRTTKDADGSDVSTVDFHRVETRNQKVIDWVNRDHLQKGDHILVWGSLENRSYDTKQGGRRYITFVNANHINKIS